MKKEKKKYTVTIFGDPYVLVSDEVQEHVMRVAAQVDSLMNDIASASKLSDAKRIAVLASLQILDKLLALEAKEKEEKKRCELLAQKIDQECFSQSS